MTDPAPPSRADEGTEWFWRIVDADGLGDVPSEEVAALRLLCDRAARTQAAEARASTAEAEVARLKLRDQQMGYRVEAAEAQLEAAEARIAVLEAALRFYADENNYRLYGPLCGENSNFTGPDTALAALGASDANP